jgi:squalene synthase HpnC
MPPAPSQIEAASGKGAGDENFPVGSFLLPARLRPHVACYYDFARAIDDIADNPDLEAEDKIARLTAMDEALAGESGTGDPGLAKAHNLRASLLETGVDFAHARDLIIAFKQDAIKSRYASWAELMDYCNHSASPVGRYLIELHGGDERAFAASDALCNALQVINHLQDCAEDHAQLDRVYLPQDWMAQAGSGVEDLSRDAMTPGLRNVVDKCLDGTDVLLDKARTLPGQIPHRRLAMEAGVIVRIALKLTDELRRRDPIATRVELTKPQIVRCSIAGAFSGLFASG